MITIRWAHWEHGNGCLVGGGVGDMSMRPTSRLFNTVGGMKMYRGVYEVLGIVREVMNPRKKQSIGVCAARNVLRVRPTSWVFNTVGVGQMRCGSNGTYARSQCGE